MKKLVIIPAYNEEQNIVNTVESVIRDLPDYDYIVINDCSTDETGFLLRKHRFNHINLPVNLGIGGAVQTGLRYAVRFGYDLAVQVDGDGQHDAIYLHKMEQTMEDEHADMVIGSRFIENKGFQSSCLRRLGIHYFELMVWLCTGKRITDPTSGQRMFGKRIIAEFADNYPFDYPEPETLAAALRKGFRVKEIPLEMKERKGGRSSIGIRNSVYYMIKVSFAIIMETTRGKRRHYD